MKRLLLIVLFLFSRYSFSQTAYVVEIHYETGFGIPWELIKHEDDTMNYVYLRLPFPATDGTTGEIFVYTKTGLDSLCSLLSTRAQEKDSPIHSQNYQTYNFIFMCTKSGHNHVNEDYIFVRDTEYGQNGKIKKADALLLSKELMTIRDLITFECEAFY